MRAAFPTSEESDTLLAEAHVAAATFLGARDADEVVFGQNMTTLTFAVSRAIGRTLRAGDEIVVTRLDHDANVAPWLALEEERGAVVHWVEIRPDDCTLDMDSLERALGPRTRVVAVGLASNAVGTVSPVARIVEMAHDVGAWTYVDAVHAAPHLAIDAAALGPTSWFARRTSSRPATSASFTGGASCSTVWPPTRSGRPPASRPASGRRARSRVSRSPGCSDVRLPGVARSGVRRR